jgi:hypothetical protein
MAGILSASVAPAFVRSESLMRISPIIVPDESWILTGDPLMPLVPSQFSHILDESLERTRKSMLLSDFSSDFTRYAGQNKPIKIRIPKRFDSAS